MKYYEVAVGGLSRGAKYSFTYSSDTELTLGTIVEVLFRNKKALGFIVKKSAKPEFKTHPISTYSSLVLPESVTATCMELAGKYPFSGQQLVRLFLPPSIKEYPPKENSPKELKELEPLSTEQTAIVESILTKRSSSLLFGDTGTGKTRMYCHVLKEILASGKNAILLEPEIGLASFIYDQIKELFPDTLLYHSTMTPKQRQMAWQRAQSTKSGLLVVGPRSALTLPLQNLGIVITDEAHDAAYRQDNSPYTYSQAIISTLVKHTPDSFYLYGSATPDVSAYYFANKLGMDIYRIKTQAAGNVQTKVPLTVSTKDTEQMQPGKLLLKASKELLSKTFKQGGQAMILINRRGTARMVRCEECGHELACPTCGHLYVYHHDTHRLHCHFCQSRTDLPTTCKECGHSPLSMIPFGTKALELEITKMFPGVNVKRFDTDTSKEDHLSNHTKSLESGEVQCIIGTQMIAKGLDLPKLQSLVVIEGANGSGYMNEERQFQLLYQVVGRAHRGHQDASVVIQSDNHLSPIIAHVLSRDYESFYETEIAERKKFFYPPFCFMMVIHYNRKSSKSAEAAGKKLVSEIRSSIKGVDVIGPLANISEKLRDNYNWHILVKSSKRSILQEVAEMVGSGWVYEFDPIDTP